ncbi:Ribonuclease H1 [Apiospora arundinis]
MNSSRSRSREVSRGRTRRTSQSRTRTSSQGDRPRPQRSRSSSFRERFQGTTVDNALSSITRGVRNLLGFNRSSLDGCPKHGAAECLSCMCHIDVNGRVSKDGTKIDLTQKVDEPPNVGITPVFGEEAHFDPLSDPHMRSRINAESTNASQTKVPANFTTPSRKWFSYCSSCEVTYLIGLAGEAAAGDHPSHAATSVGYRSICVYVDAGVNEDGQGVLTGDSSVFFGPKSKHNALSKSVYDLEHPRSIQSAALRRALRLASTIMQERHGLVQKHGLSNSHKFLWESCTKFRLVVFSRMEVVNSWLNFDRDATGQGQSDTQLEAELLKIDNDIQNLGMQGIEVKFLPLPPFHKYEPEYEFFYDRFI